MNPFTVAIENADSLGTSRQQALQFLREAAEKFLPEFKAQSDPAEFKIELYDNYDSLYDDRTVSTREEIADEINRFIDDCGSDYDNVRVWASVPIKVETERKITFL